MPYEDFQKNWKNFTNLLNNMPKLENKKMDSLTKQYMELNVSILNDVFTASIDNLRCLQKAQSANDIICTQARFTAELNKKISTSTQRFINASLGNIADYNEWLKAHCDLATD